MEELITITHAQKFGLAKGGHIRVLYDFHAKTLRDMPVHNCLTFGSIYKVPFKSDTAHANWAEKNLAPVICDTSRFGLG